LLSKFCALFYHETLANSIYQSTQQGEKKRNKERGLKSAPKKKKNKGAQSGLQKAQKQIMFQSRH
jgi:hypothetical protein